MLKYSIAALALVASSTFALADPNNGGPGGGGGSAGGAAMERSGGGTGGAMKGGQTEGNGASSGSLRGSDTKGERSSATEDRSGSMGKNTASEEKASKSEKSGGSQASDEKGKGQERNRQASDNDKNLKNDQRNDRADRNDRNEGKNSDQARDNSRLEKGSTGASEGTEGKVRAKGELSGVSSEQKTKVISAFSSHRVAPERNIGVAVNVGVKVPRSVHFYPIPDEIVTIVPDYRGYEYFMIDDSHVAIVDPDSLQVVDILVIA